MTTQGLIPALLFAGVIMIAGCRERPVEVVVVHDESPTCPTTPIHVYMAGTTIPVTLYLDAQMTTPMTNPFLPECRNGRYTFYTAAKSITVVEGESFE